MSLQPSPVLSLCSMAPACRHANADAPPSQSRSTVGRSVRRAASALRDPSTTIGHTPVWTGKPQGAGPMSKSKLRKGKVNQFAFNFLHKIAPQRGGVYYFHFNICNILPFKNKTVASLHHFSTKFRQKSASSLCFGADLPVKLLTDQSHSSEQIPSK